MGSITQPNDNKLLLFFILQICGLTYLSVEMRRENESTHPKQVTVRSCETSAHFSQITRSRQPEESTVRGMEWNE
jgi:hypothetical protein